jgi:hypothetical protein
VRTWIVIGLASVVRASDNLAIAHDNRTDGHLALVSRRARLL